MASNKCEWVFRIVGISSYVGLLLAGLFFNFKIIDQYFKAGFIFWHQKYFHSRSMQFSFDVIKHM